MNGEMEEGKNAKKIESFLIPFLRIVVSIIFLINIYTQISILFKGKFLISDSINLIILLINFLLINFYFLEFRNEIKGTFIKAFYFRISTILLELILIIKSVFSAIYLISVVNEHPSIWISIIEQTFFAILISILLFQNIKRTKSLH